MHSIVQNTGRWFKSNGSASSERWERGRLVRNERVGRSVARVVSQLTIRQPAGKVASSWEKEGFAFRDFSCDLVDHLLWGKSLIHEITRSRTKGPSEELIERHYTGGAKPEALGQND